MEDILEALDNGGDAFSATSTTSSATPKQEEKDTFDYWGDPNVEPMKIDRSKLHSSKKRFTLCVFNKYQDLDEATENKIVGVAKHLISKGYTFRHTGAADDALQNKILKIDGIVVESIIPWKKWNLNIERPKLYKPKGTAYKIAANSHKAFKKLKNPVRVILARNVHSLLGPDCTDPSTLLLCYNPAGTEVTRGIDFKEAGDLGFFLKVAEDSNIPAFNIKKDDSIKRLSEFLKIKE